MMGIASFRILALLTIVLVPSVAHAQPAGAPRVTTDSAATRTAVDTGALSRRAIDSLALRHAIDSATRRAIDSAFGEFAQDRSDWRLVIWGLLLLVVVFLGLLVFDITRGHDVLVESHWGGFGGGVGGTRLSRTLVLAVLLLLAGGMLTVVAVSHPGRPRSDGGRARDSLQKLPPGVGGRALPSNAPTSDRTANERAPGSTG